MPIKISMAAARTNANLTQKQLAAFCGVSETTVIKWEKGEAFPRTNMLRLLEEAYGIPLDYVRFPG